MGHPRKPMAMKGTTGRRDRRGPASAWVMYTQCPHLADSTLTTQNSIPRTPPILPRYSDKAELATRASVDTGASIELDRVLAVYR